MFPFHSIEYMHLNTKKKLTLGQTNVRPHSLNFLEILIWKRKETAEFCLYSYNGEFYRGTTDKQV